MKMNKIIFLSVLLGVGQGAFAQDMGSGGDFSLAAPTSTVLKPQVNLGNEEALRALAADPIAYAFFTATHDDDLEKAAARLDPEMISGVFPQAISALMPYYSVFKLKPRQVILANGWGSLCKSHPEEIRAFRSVLQGIHEKRSQALSLNTQAIINGIDPLYAEAVLKSTRELLISEAHKRRDPRA